MQRGVYSEACPPTLSSQPAGSITDSGSKFPKGVAVTLQGDNDPVDVVEIGSTQLKMGGVYKVKPLGELGLAEPCCMRCGVCPGLGH
jgi:hypothetical protein